MRYALLLLFALLPLQWFIVTLPVLGRLPLHLVAMLVFTGGVLAWLRPRAFRDVYRLSAPLVWAHAALVTVWAGAAFYHGQSTRDAAEQGILLVAFLAVAAGVHHVLARRPDRLLDTLRWSAAVAVGSLILALAVSTLINGVNAGGVIQSSVASGDPEVLTRGLFQPAFEGFGLTGEQAKSNLRHEIFGAILVSALVSAVAGALRPPTSSTAQWLLRLSTALAVLLVVTSLSRAVLLAACAWPVLALWRVLRSGTFTVRQAALTVGLAATALGLAAVGVLSVVWARFTQDTSSYEARQGLFQQSVEFLSEHPFTGGFETAGASSHNLVIDTWLRAGILAAAAAVIVIAWMASLLIRTAVDLHREPRWMVPAVALLALPLVRAFTVGGGALPPVQWVCLGLAVGLLAWRTGQRAAPARVPLEPVARPISP